MAKVKNVYRAARGSGYFPLTFNFVKLEDGKYIQCAFCGAFVFCRKITRDHVYPKSLGGQLKAPACMTCNILKENMLPIEWARYAYEKNLDIATIPLGAEYIQEEMEKTKETLRVEILTLISNLLLSYNG